MTCREIQELLQAGGFTLSVAADGRLLVSPGGRLTDDMRAAIREHKEALIDEVRMEEEIRFMDSWDEVKNYL